MRSCWGSKAEARINLSMDRAAEAESAAIMLASIYATSWGRIHRIAPNFGADEKAISYHPQLITQGE